MPTAEAVTAMVNAGWAFSDLMMMTARDFSFWFARQKDHVAAKAKAMQEASRKA